VADYGLATYGHHLILDDNCAVPALSCDASVLAISGPPARWAYPAADSIAGMKYASRRFAEHVLGRQRFGLGRFAAWCGMVRGGWPYSPDTGQDWRGDETCATP
jgi:hypothetical protein